jgi:hypothetical protein
MTPRYKILLPYFLCFAMSMVSCDDFIKIDPPRTDLVRSTIFTNDGTANAAVADMYSQLKNSGFASGSTSGISLLAALSADEMIQYSQRNADQLLQFNENSLQSNNVFLTSLWSNIYLGIYKANAVIEGLSGSSGMTEKVRGQLSGEAKFIRAFCLFYAVNLWGDVPLPLTTDYKINNAISRSSRETVYQQIVADILDAQGQLKDDFSFSGGERVRVNLSAANALLARVYLYMEDWQNAEIQATKLIENTTYRLETDLTSVFRTTSKEAILQFWSDEYPKEFSTFYVSGGSGPNFGALRPEFANDFESGDLRSTTWTKLITYDGTNYLAPTKYVNYDIPPIDYSTVLRLAEQFLIRAEARAHLNKLPASAADLNVIRNRAGLANTPAGTQTDLLDAIMRERKVELFCESGHRWFDLKRTHQADAVLGVIKRKWSSGDALYPIPEAQIISDPLVTQNPN